MLDLATRIAMTDRLAYQMYVGAWGLLGALGTLAATLSFVRSAIVGSGEAAKGFFIRLLVVLAVLSAYDTIFDTTIAASVELSEYIAEQAGWDNFWRAVGEQFGNVFDPEEATSGWDRLLGFVQGGLLSVGLGLSYYLQFMMYLGVGYLTATIAGVLHVVGPLVIVGGLFAEGQSLKLWLGALLQVALWPSIPPILILVNTATATAGLQSDNTAFVLAQNLILTALCAATPAIVAFVVGKGGITSLAGGVNTMLNHVGMAAMQYAAVKLRTVGQAGSGAAAAYVRQHLPSLSGMMPSQGLHAAAGVLRNVAASNALTTTSRPGDHAGDVGSNGPEKPPQPPTSVQRPASDTPPGA